MSARKIMIFHFVIVAVLPLCAIVLFDSIGPRLLNG